MIVYFSVGNMQLFKLAPSVRNPGIEMICSLERYLERWYAGFLLFLVFNRCTVVLIWLRRWYGMQNTGQPPVGIWISCVLRLIPPEPICGRDGQSLNMTLDMFGLE